MYFQLLLVLLGATVSLFLFKKAGAYFGLTKVNITTYILYTFFLQTYIGASLAYLGDRNHYTFKMLLNQNSVNSMFYSVLATAILLPLTMIIIFKINKINIKNRYEAYINQKASDRHEKIYFYLILLVSAVGLALLGVYIYKIGYLPLWKLINPPDADAFSFGTERMRISGMVIIHSYIKNIVILTFIPVLSYMAFAFMLCTKKLRWILLFSVLFLSSVVVKTIAFEKSAVVFYPLVFLFIYIYIKGAIKKRYITVLAAVMIASVFIIYAQTGYTFSFNQHDLYNGPIGRTIFTQAGTLTLNYDFFPQVCRFLNGQGLSKVVFFLAREGPRSAKILMEYYGSVHVYNGTAGVMNGLFIGEAYANYGYIGMTVSILYIGGLLSFFLWLFTKMKKSVMNAALFATLTCTIATTTQGGFLDFIYSAITVSVILLFAAMNLLVKWIGRRKKEQK